MLVNVVFFAYPGTSFLNIVINFFKGRQVKKRIHQSIIEKDGKNLY